MAFGDTMHELHTILTKVVVDLSKVHKGNKSAAQRVRVGTIDLEKIAKQFRKESVAAEKNGRLKKKSAMKRNKRKKKR